MKIGMDYDKLTKKLIPQALNLTRGNAQDAKDLIQDTLYKLLIYKPNAEQEEAEKLSHVIIKTKFIDSLRTRKSISQLTEVPGTTENLGPIKIEWSDTLKKIQNLPPLKRKLILLHLDGYTPSEIAKITGLAYNTVPATIFAAKKYIVENKIIFPRSRMPKEKISYQEIFGTQPEESVTVKPPRKPRNSGVKKSDTHKEKISSAMSGKIKDEEHKNKIRLALQQKVDRKKLLDQARQIYEMKQCRLSIKQIRAYFGISECTINNRLKLLETTQNDFE